LVADGGTGDAMIMLAQPLVDAGVAAGTVTYLDMSMASRTIAEDRAAARGLTNIGSWPERSRRSANSVPAPMTTSIAAAFCIIWLTRNRGCGLWQSN